MKKSIVSGLIFSITLWCGLGGCTKQSEDKLSKNPGACACDTTSVKYATDIVPILQNNCYECHGNGSSAGSGGILLEGYSNLVPWAANGSLARLSPWSHGAVTRSAFSHCFEVCF
jgi:hypothetical protein